MKEIPVSRGKYTAFVDDEDYDFLMQWKWRAKKDKNTSYAVRDEKDKDGKITKFFMHRVIMNAEKGKVVDHIDGDGLNNTKSNLRVCTTSENSRNIRLNTNRKGKSSIYKGVHFCNRSKKFVAQIMINQRGKHIGYFDTEVEAAKAYNKRAIELFGEFACLNNV